MYNKNEIVLGVKQSILTSITRKCGLVEDKNTDCDCYKIEKEKLQKLF